METEIMLERTNTPTSPGERSVPAVVKAQVAKVGPGLAGPCLIAIFAIATTLCAPNPLAAEDADNVVLQGDGLLRTRSAYSVAETVERLRADIEGKGIMFFTAIDQGELGRGADIELPPSQLILFGNPPLGVLFLTSNPESGMDWPVRMLIHEDKAGAVWTVYQDWNWVAARYAIGDRQAEFAKATEVVASIVASVADCNPIADCTE
ncbi:DUF302 domain-containing protein [Tabrizicola sp.]|uniref:DUF302 domain-containing protein n=1 Tax=Tabrizicola sp. TaxID=2005166 RepID=UPI003F36D8BE